MPSLLFDQLENAGLIKDNKPSRERVQSLLAANLLELAEESTHLTSAADVPRADSIFVHSATLSLGGGRHPCAAFQCRLDHIRELAHFAALYSDRVYIRNFFMDHSVHPKRRRELNESELRRQFYNDLLLLTEIRPLVEAGRIVPITPPGNRCPRCLWERDTRSEVNQRLRPEFDRLRREFFERCRVSVEHRGQWYMLLADGPSDLLEHGIGYRRSTLPASLAQMPRLLAQIKAGKRVVLGRDTRRRMGLHDRLANEEFRNIIFETVLAEALSTSFLTERPLHLRVLNSLTRDTEIQARNHLVLQHMTALVPFAEDVSVTDLLTLRAREEESFELFRQRLNGAVDEMRRRRQGFSRDDARQIYADVLAPAIAAMDRKVMLAKRDLAKATFRRTASWVGAISFGVYAGFLPPGLAGLAGTIGLAKVLQEFSETLMTKSDTQQSIREEPLYFLWRVRQKSSIGA